jgi:pyruvate/2-oxoglutarate dehydrogenase complex dihydrolipoamide acyltransferase (E2) component
MGSLVMVTSDDGVEVRIAHSGLAEQVVILDWLVSDGGNVEQGAPLVVLESEKTQLEIESPASGTLRILVDASDDDVPAGTLIALIIQ